MYKLSIPIQNRGVTDNSRSDYLTICRRAKVDRIFLTASLNENYDLLKYNIAFFKENGFEVGIWIGNTIGHGATLLESRNDGSAPKYQRLVNLDGQDLYSTNCPYDKAFQRSVAEKVARLALCGSDMIMLDDDYRISQHSAQPCCFCELHMARIRELCGEDVSREDLKKLVFTGKRNKYRDAYLQTQGESLEELARVIRAEVDKVNPKVSVSACSAYCSWDLDGTDPIRLTKIFAGENKAFLRLHGAPYWAPHNGKPVEAIPEIERMFASFCKDEDIEIFSEGDVYPRPRFNTPASYLEIMDGALRADGRQDGILKYMLEYCDNPLYELSYVERHIRNLEKLNAIESFFPQGANAGVRVLIKPHLMDDADLDLSPVRQQSPYPVAGILLAMNGIPTVYDGEGCCAALFGENARHFDVSDFKKGAILDGAAAVILHQRGIDVGIDEIIGFAEEHFGGIYDDVTKIGKTSVGAHMGVLGCKLKEGARKELSIEVNGCHKTLAYQYENADGQKFLVFTFHGDGMIPNPKFLYAYTVQAALQRGIEWIAGEELPVKTYKHPALYTLCEKGEDYTSVALFNCYPDSALDLTVELDREYEHVEFSNCTGHIDGNAVILDGEIHAFDFASFKAYN